MYGTTDERRTKLSRMYYFQCQCIKCQDDTADQMKSSLKCSSCDGGCVPTATAICTSCQSSVDPSLIKYHQQMKTRLFNFFAKRGHKILPGELFENYEKAVRIYHPYDTDFIELLKLFNVRLKEVGYTATCLEILRLMLINLCQNLPRYDSTIGLTKICAAEICTNLRLFKEAKTWIGEAEDILSVNLGRDHPLIVCGCAKIRRDIQNGLQKSQEPIAKTEL